MLVGFWLIDEKPTGSKDPYALRRAALGVIRIILENKLRLPLMKIFIPAHVGISDEIKHLRLDQLADALTKLERRVFLADERIAFCGKLRERSFLPNIQNSKSMLPMSRFLPFDCFSMTAWKASCASRVLATILPMPCLRLEDEDDLLMMVGRVEALGKFLDTEDGKNLLAGYKRATNILRIEEKKDARQYVGRPDPSLYRQDEEWALAKAIDAAKTEASAAVAREDFEAAMRAMAKLRPHVDAFFDKVTVNVAEGANKEIRRKNWFRRLIDALLGRVADGADKDKLRENRLKLLNEIREATRAVADFSKIEG